MAAWLEGASHPFTPSLQITRILQYLREAKRLNPRQARRALFFTWFDFVITYRPGYCKADALSRLHSTNAQSDPEPILPPALIVSPILWNIDKDIHAATQTESAPLPSQHPNGNPFWAQFIIYRALGIQAANGPSRSSKLGTSGPVCPVMSPGTSAVAQSVPCPRLLITFRWASSCPSLFRAGPGHTWE